MAQLKRAFYTNDPIADLNADGVVNFADLAIMKKAVFKKPGPAASIRRLTSPRQLGPQSPIPARRPSRTISLPPDALLVIHASVASREPHVTTVYASLYEARADRAAAEAPAPAGVAKRSSYVRSASGARASKGTN